MLAKKFGALIFGVVFISTCEAQQIELKLNLEKDRVYKQVSSSKVDIAQDINGQQLIIGMNIRGTMAYLVKLVNESFYEMEVQYENLRIDMELPQVSLSFDSEKPGDIMSQMLGELKNKPFHVSMNKNGKVHEVKNLEGLFATLFDKFPNIPADQREQIKAQLMKAYGPEAFKGNIEMVTAIFPDHAISKGDKWHIETKLESGMSANVSTTYEYQGENDNNRLVRGESKITTADKDAYVESNGMRLKYDLNGTMISDIKIDLISGWILEANITQELKGDAYVKENEKMPQGMKIPMTMKSITLITQK